MKYTQVAKKASKGTKKYYKWFNMTLWSWNHICENVNFIILLHKT
jgi:hypothetical protein